MIRVAIENAPEPKVEDRQLLDRARFPAVDNKCRICLGWSGRGDSSFCDLGSYGTDYCGKSWCPYEEGYYLFAV